jgi:hypothetical protein
MSQLCAHVLRWIAPAAACLFFAVALLTGERPSLVPQSFDRPGISTLASNQIPNSTGPERSGSSENSVSPASFGWTNHDAYTSSITSFLPGKFN